MLTDHKQIRAWIDTYKLQFCTINIHDEVDCTGDVQLWRAHQPSEFDTSRIKFGTVLGNFGCGCTRLDSIGWLPSYVGGRFDCSATGITSYAGFHKRVKYVGGNFIGSPHYFQSHLLGLLLIDGIKQFDFCAGNLNQIMNKYAGTGNVILAQDELIDAGFIEQAKL